MLGAGEELSLSSFTSLSSSWSPCRSLRPAPRGFGKTCPKRLIARDSKHLTGSRTTGVGSTGSHKTSYRTRRVSSLLSMAITFRRVGLSRKCRLSKVSWTCRRSSVFRPPKETLKRGTKAEFQQLPESFFAGLSIELSSRETDCD